MTMEPTIKKIYASRNLPPAFVPQGGASRRQVAPLCQIPRKAGPFVKGGKEGWGEGTHFISPPLRGGDEGEGELCQFI